MLPILDVLCLWKTNHFNLVNNNRMWLNIDLGNVDNVVIIANKNMLNLCIF